MTSPASAPKPASPVPRTEILRNALLDTVSLLKCRKAAEIDEGLIDDYVALNWLEWNGGGLQLTVTGSNVCKQMTVREA